MEFADLGLEVTVVYEDLSDVWPVISQALEAQLPLRQVSLINKLGATVYVDQMPLQLVSSLDPALNRLQKYCHSAVAWFRQPAVSLVLISCMDAEDYKRNFRLQLRAMIDVDARHPLAPEPVFVYIAPPPTPDMDAKAPSRVIDAMRRELGSRRRERVVRIDPPLNPSEPPMGMDSLVACIKAALSASLEARIAAYNEVVRQQLAALQSAAPEALPSAFSEFYLIKDSLAVMMEASGLLEDAVREYLELEVAYQQAEQGRQHRPYSFGVPRGGGDEAEGFWSTWRSCRAAVLHSDEDGGAPPVLALRQAVFASQSRVLLKLRRHGEVLERGLSFLLHLNAALAAQEQAGRGPRLLKETWTFAGCVTLAAAVATRHQHQHQHRHQFEGKNSNNNASSSFSFTGGDGGGGASSFLMGILEEGQREVLEETEEEEVDAVDEEKNTAAFSSTTTTIEYWRLGALPSPSSPLLNDNNITTTTIQDVFTLQSSSSSSSSSREVYCLLGQLYCIARDQLEALASASQGWKPPHFMPTILEAASVLSDHLAATTAAVENNRASGGSGGDVVITSPSTSPRRTLQSMRSVSPTRSSFDMGGGGGGARGSFMSASGGGLSFNGESIDEPSSLSVRIPTQEQSPFSQEQMQTIDLNAPGGSAEEVIGGGKVILNNSGEENNSSSSNGAFSPMAAAAAAGGGAGFATTTTTGAEEATSASAHRRITDAAAAERGGGGGVEIAPVMSSLMSSLPSSSSLASSTTPHGVSQQPSAPPPQRLIDNDAPVSTPPPPPPLSNSAASTTTTAALSAEPSSSSSTTAIDGGGASLFTEPSGGGGGLGEEDGGATLWQIERVLDAVMAERKSTSTTLVNRRLTASSASRRSSSSQQELLAATPKPLLSATVVAVAPMAATPPNTTTTAASPSMHTSNVKIEDWSPVHWRLRRALASPAAFADLWEALSTAAAICFEQGGRWRQAVMCRSQVADCLAVRGELIEAASMYEELCRMALQEGWNSVAGACLPKLAMCQAKLRGAGLVHTAAALLILNSSSNMSSSKMMTLSALYSAVDVESAAKLLTLAAAQPSAGLSFSPPLLPLTFSTTPATAAAGAAGGGGGFTSFSPEFEYFGVDLSSVLAVKPVKGLFSRFFKRNDAETGRPLLCPTTVVTTDGSAPPTHVQCAVGDVVEVCLEVVNRLQSTLTLADVRLLLVGMHEMTALASPRSSSPRHMIYASATATTPSLQHNPNNNNPRNSFTAATSAAVSVNGGGGGASFTPRQAPTPSASSVGGAPPSRSGGGGGGPFPPPPSSPFYRADSFAHEGGPRFTTEWQDAEDLQCCLIGISPPIESTTTANTTLTKEKKKTSSSSLLQPASGAVQLPPGVSTLRFMAAPLKRGLYRPVHLTALLNNLEIRLAVGTGSALEDASMLSPRQVVNDSGGGAENIFSISNGSAKNSSSSHHDAVVLEVDPPLPRVEINAATFSPKEEEENNSTSLGLVAGQRQWLSLYISPNKDVLQEATLSVSWPLPPAVATTTLARRMSGLLLSHSTSSPLLESSSTGAPSPLLGEVSFSAASAAGGGDVGAVPALVPLHPAAVCIRKGEDDEANVVVVTASGPTTTTATAGGTTTTTTAAWADDGYQEYTLPPTDHSPFSSSSSASAGGGGGGEIGGDGGVRLWWWVETGSFSVPAEQVRVDAPGAVPSTSSAPSALPFTISSGIVNRDVTLNHYNHHATTAMAMTMATMTSPDGISQSQYTAAEKQYNSVLLDVPLSLQYLSGCRRTYSKVLQLPVHQPFTVRTAARELATGDIIMHCHVTSLLPHPSVITATSVVLQPGLILKRDLGAELELLPIAVAPNAVFSLSFALTVDRSMAAGDRAAAQLRLQQAAKLQPTALQLKYTVQLEDVCGGNDIASSSFTSSVPPIKALNQLDAAVAAPLSSSSSTTTTTTSTQHQACCFIHRCALELSPLKSDIPGAVVMMQLLGPFSAVAGQPLSLCWRLERAGAAASATAAAAVIEPLRVQFELAGEGESWRPVGRQQGCVVLESYDGALATIEATWVPLVAGTLVVPSLRLVDVAFQEIHEVGSGGVNYVVVAASK